MADASAQALEAQSQMTVDPESLISPQATVQPSSGAEAHVDVEKPLAPIPANLKNLITDQILDARLQSAGLSIENPQMREKLRESLYVGMQYAALPLSDPRFLGHAAHMDMDANGIKQQLAGLGQKIIDVQEQGAKAMTRLQKNGEAGRSAAVAGIGAGIAAAVTSGVVGYLKLVRRISGVGMRFLAALGIGAAAGALVGNVTGRVMGSGVAKEHEEIVREGRGLAGQYQQLAEAVQGYENSVKEEFLNVHMQRAVKKQAQHQAAEAQHLLQQTNHHLAANQHSAGEENPRIHPHTPVASAHLSQSAGEDGPRLNAHVPVAAAHDGGHASAAHESHAGAPYNTFDNRIPPGGDAPAPWSSFKNPPMNASADVHAGDSLGTSADVAGAVGKFTSMHAPKAHDGGHAAAHESHGEAGHASAVVQQKEHANAAGHQLS